ncbi:MAG: hypothetical protein ACOYN2_04235 [Patescibacteria group bacterium]
MNLFEQRPNVVVDVFCNSAISMKQQIARAQAYFPELIIPPDIELNDQEGLWFIPDWTNFAPNYNVAVNMVLKKLSTELAGVFFDFTHGRLSAKYLTNQERLALAGKLVRVEFIAPEDVQSILQPRVSIDNEIYDLGVYEFAMMYLLEPERFHNSHDCWIDLRGDFWSAPEDCAISGSRQMLHFWFNQGRIALGSHGEKFSQIPERRACCAQ